MSGAISEIAGRLAEGIVARRYDSDGALVTHHRWRGRGGEIDLIAREGDSVVFVEVKKSRTFSRAAEALRPRQVKRIFNAATEFLGSEPRGSLTPTRFDVALVDDHGRCKVIRNAYAACAM